MQSVDALSAVERHAVLVVIDAFVTGGSERVLPIVRSGTSFTYPLTAPAVRAPMMNRWSTRNTMMAGTIESTLAAARICVDVWL